jgi:hypothetical protein
MHVSSIGAAHIPQAPGNKDVPPGLQRRDLDMPPGIAKKLDADGTVPPGIAKRFPAAVVPTETPSEPTTDTQPSEGTTVDIVV